LLNFFRGDSQPIYFYGDVMKKFLAATIAGMCLCAFSGGCLTDKTKKEEEELNHLKPELVHNDYYKKVGEKQADKDIHAAMKSAADEVIKREKAKKGEKIAGTVGTVAAGTAVREETGSMGAGFGVSAGIRAIRKRREKKREEMTFEELVEANLSQKGYEIKSWNHTEEQRYRFRIGRRLRERLGEE